MDAVAAVPAEYPPLARHRYFYTAPAAAVWMVRAFRFRVMAGAFCLQPESVDAFYQLLAGGTRPEKYEVHPERPAPGSEAGRRGRGVGEPLRVTGDVQVWEEPVAGEFYGIGVDTAEGLAHGDNAVISVVRVSRGE